MRAPSGILTGPCPGMPQTPSRGRLRTPGGVFVRGVYFPQRCIPCIDPVSDKRRDVQPNLTALVVPQEQYPVRFFAPESITGALIPRYGDCVSVAGADML